MLGRFGTFTRSQADSTKVTFIPSSELVSGLSLVKNSEVAQSECVGPEWSKIAPAAQIPSQDLAKSFIQAVLMICLEKAKRGNEVTVTLKIGKLTLAQGQVSFASERFQAITAA